jgi:uridine kinase
VTTILVRTGKGGRDGIYPATPDFVFDDLREGAEFIIEGKRKLEKATKEIVRFLNSQETLKIIAVGGPARSGKSTFAICLKDHLQSKGHSVSVVSLDHWILGVEERTDTMTVRDRFKYQGIERDMVRLINGEEVKLRLYDPFSREVGSEKSLSLGRVDYLIIDGIPSLDMKGVREISDLLIYCKVNERERKRRFISFYRWKGLPDGEIMNLYTERMQDEIPFVEGSKKYADFIIANGEIEVFKEK